MFPDKLIPVATARDTTTQDLSNYLRRETSVEKGGIPFIIYLEIIDKEIMINYRGVQSVVAESTTARPFISPKMG